MPRRPATRAARALGPTPKTRATLHGTTREPVPLAKRVGPSNPREEVSLSVYVRRNPGGNRDALAWLGTQNGVPPKARQYLSREQFTHAFGAARDDMDKTARWLTTAKLHVEERNDASRRILVRGTIAAVQKAFRVELSEYEHAELGRFRGREGELSVPLNMAGVITAVAGLDTRRVGRSRLRRSNDKPTELDTPARVPRKTRDAGGATIAKRHPGTFLPPKIAELYDYPAGDGKGQNVAVFAFNEAPRLGGYSRAALQTYFEDMLGIAMPHIEDVVVHGPGNSPGPDTPGSNRQGDATGEVMLDVCVVGSLLPKANIFVYFTEFTTKGWLDALYAAITDDNDISVISISYGNAEDDPNGLWTAAEIDLVNEAFQAASSRGITICVASGDDGTKDGVARGWHVDFPASSPYVWAVGGTRLTATPDNARIASEVVWNAERFGDGATGGGISAIFSKPAYQRAVDVPPAITAPHQIGRGVPDAAAVADPRSAVLVIHVDGKHLDPVGGTSASAPLWASLVARINAANGARCGLLNEIMYHRFATGVLREIEVGDNGGYAAKAGWDPCTGLGVPGGTALLYALRAER